MNTCPNCKKHEFKYKDRFVLALKNGRGKCPECGAPVRLTKGRFIVLSVLSPDILSMLLFLFLFIKFGFWGMIPYIAIVWILTGTAWAAVSSVVPKERKFTIYNFLSGK